LNETRAFARWLANLRFSDLPADVVDFTKRFILDDVGLALGGALQLSSTALMRDVLAQGETPQSTIPVYGHKTSMRNAALLNGAFICGWDYDAMTRGGAHMSSEFAVALAMVEQALPDGEEMITAVCAGIEAQARIGSVTRPGPYWDIKSIPGWSLYPWHTNTTIGPIAGAVAAGKLLRLDEDAMHNAIAICTHTMGGNYQHMLGWGSSMKRIRCGIGASAGLRAAFLAQDGMTGPGEALEGSKGYVESMFGRGEDGQLFGDLSLATNDLGTFWHTVTYASKGGGCYCVSAMGSSVEATLALKEKYGFKPQDVESVVVEFVEERQVASNFSLRGTMLGETPLQRLGTSGWSAQWILAEVIVVGKPTIDVQLNNIRPYGQYQAIEELATKISGRGNRAYYEEHFKDRPYPREPGRVLIQLKDGRLLDGEPIPYVGTEMSDGSIYYNTMETLTAKLEEQAPLAGISRKKQDKLVEICSHLEDAHDLRPLIANMIR
jgi:2-methylcitrate dehydratase PrpD